MILHILSRAEWEEALSIQSYRPPSLRDEGFIHCSTVGQVVETANLFFRGRRDLLIVCIDEARLAWPLKLEAPASTGHARTAGLFPHIYGPLNLDAVTAVHEFPCKEDGEFELPGALRE